MDLDYSGLAEELARGFRAVGDILDRTHSTLAADPILADLAVLLEGSSGVGAVRAAVLSLLDVKGEPLAVEAMQYLAYRFRWQWMEDELKVRSMENSDLRLARFYELILEAFSDDWEDREFFPSLDGFRES